MIASASSILLTVVSARSLPQNEFGLLALIIACFTLTTGWVRSFGIENAAYSDPQSIIASSSTGIRDSFSATVLLSGFLGLAVGLLAGTWTGDVVVGLVAGGLAPLLATQDFYRILAVIKREPAIALFRMDLPALLLLAASLHLLNPANLREVIASWAIAVALSTAFFAIRIGSTFNLPGALAWVWRLRRKGWAYFLDFTVSSGFTQASIFLVTAVVGLSGAAGMRGAQTLITPITLATRGITIAISPELANAARQGRHARVSRTLWVFCLCVVAGTAAAAFIPLALPQSIVALALGDSTRPALDALPWVALAAGTLGLSMAPGLGLRAYGHVWMATKTRLWLALPGMALLTALSMYFGLAGSQVALAMQNLLRASLNYRSLRTIIRMI